MTAADKPDLPPLPASSLPSWDECALRVHNSEYIAKRVAGGGYGAEHDSKLASELHRFIYEYDDADAYRSGWFRHRLERLLADERRKALDQFRPAVMDAIDLLTLDADALRECSTHSDGSDYDWTGEPEAKSDYDRMLRTVAALRALIDKEPT